MHEQYLLQDASGVFSPGLLFYKDLIAHNIDRMIAHAGGVQRLRPHVKTHKTREISEMKLKAGITKLKCATIAEAEMLAQVGVPDVLLAYNMIGPNCERFGLLVQKYPRTRFSVLADHPLPTRALSDVLARNGQKVPVLIDLDVGQHRTGIAPGADALALYESFAKLPGLEPGGFHVYDGHNHADKPEDRAAAVRQEMDVVLSFRAGVEKKGLPIPSLVVGGTPSFLAFAQLNLPGLECAPGTCVLHDHGYGTHFCDLADFIPAALVLTRVISRPTSRTLTLDLGYKAIASDPPAGKRCVLLNVPDYEPVLQNEEHFVVATPAADKFQPGDVVYALPTHVCPTSALHKFAYVVEKGHVIGTWDIVARDRMLTV